MIATLLTILRWTATVVLTVLVVGSLPFGIWLKVSGDDLLHVATGSVARALCSAAFVSEVDADQLFDEEERPQLHGLDHLMTYDEDDSTGQVTARILGAFGSTARVREGLGCLVVHDQPFPPEIGGLRPPTFAGAFAGTPLTEPADPALRAALDTAFAEPVPNYRRNTKAFVVLHDGKLIAERYAPGYGPSTPIWAHSLTKSLTQALIGTLVQSGSLRLDTPVATAAPAKPADAGTVTVDTLLRMTSGLPFDDNSDLINHLTRILFLERDLAGYAQRVPPEARPGTRWAYSNVGYILLSRLVRDAASPPPATPTAVATEAFIRHALFEPLGMAHTTIDVDAVGTPVGSSNAYGSARDFARFGQLYLDDGMVDGRRLLPEGWAAYSHSQSLATGYGAGFWTNLVDGTVAEWDAPWGMPSLPKDMFYARGALGQYVIVIPSERLVVVRMGIGYGGVEGATAQVIAALHAHASP